MVHFDADRNLLFGILALQNGLIDQGRLVAAFQARALDKSRSVADLLVARGALDEARRLGCSEKTVAREPRRIRQVWAEEVPS